VISRVANLHQLVAGNLRPAGKVLEWSLFCSWVQALPHNAYVQAAGFVKTGVAKDLDGLEEDAVDAFLAHPPSIVQRPHVEALLLAVLGRDVDADTLSVGHALPSAAENNGAAVQPVTILERAVKVGQKDWEGWAKTRQRREYLLLEIYDTILSDPGETGRNERLSAALRLLAKERRAG
jgi:hypothetical protein